MREIFIEVDGAEAGSGRPKGGRMSESGCATCSWRARHDRKPRTLLGLLWRWHANFCPGWKAYMQGLPEGERSVLIERYGFSAEKFERREA